MTCCNSTSLQKANQTKSTKKQSHNCTECGVRFEGRSLRTRRNGEVLDKIFCGRNCYDKHRSKITNAIIGYCLNCNKGLSRSSGHNSKTKYCTMECKLEHKKSKDRHCIFCGVWFSSLKWNSTTKMLVADNFRKTCSTECYRNNIKTDRARKEKISNAFKGSNHPNWQGGLSGHGNRGFRGSEWAKIRKQIIERDGFKCLSCGIDQKDHLIKYGCDFNVNHIKPFHQFGGMTELANKPRNLETLCKSCHTKKDWKYRKENGIQYVLAI